MARFPFYPFGSPEYEKAISDGQAFRTEVEGLQIFITGTKPAGAYIQGDDGRWTVRLGYARNLPSLAENASRVAEDSRRGFESPLPESPSQPRSGQPGRAREHVKAQAAPDKPVVSPSTSSGQALSNRPLDLFQHAASTIPYTCPKDAGRLVGVQDLQGSYYQCQVCGQRLEVEEVRRLMGEGSTDG